MQNYQCQGKSYWPDGQLKARRMTLAKTLIIWLVIKAIKNKKYRWHNMQKTELSASKYLMSYIC